MSDDKQNITQLLHKVSDGSDEAYARLFPIVYNRLRGLAHRQLIYDANQSITKTALVHELYLKLFQQKNLDMENRNHFFAIAARCMRQILIDHARKKKREKRGGNHQQLTYIDELVKVNEEAEEILHIDEALNRLADLDPRLAQIVELHYFGEMNFYEIAKHLGLSERTVYRDWAKARGWLYKELK